MATTSRRRGSAPAQINGGGTGARYFDEWRQNVNDELQESARLHSQAAVTFERVSGRLDEHDRVLHEHADRMAALEKTDKAQVARTIAQADTSPDRMRANLSLIISGFVGLLYLVTFVAAHWR